MSPTTTRWCPTPEQLMILEEMYRGGIKTPNASQIQQITAHLANYGRIQGKNVFYWFQNHKARDRQKLRKRLSKQHFQLQHFQLQHYRQQLLFNHHLKQHQINHDMLHFLGSPAPAMEAPVPGLQHLAYYNPASTVSLPNQKILGGVEDGSLQETICNSYTSNNKVENKDDDDEKKKMEMEMEMRRYEQSRADLMMMMMMEKSYSAVTATTKPIKTLELFPLTASNLKEECK